MVIESRRERFLNWITPIHLDPEDHTMDKPLVINVAPTGAFIKRMQNPNQAYTGEEVKIKITDATGATVAKLKAPGTPGLNRIAWDLKPTKDVLTEYGGEGQKHVKPGEYTVTLVFGSYSQSEKIQVKIAPDVDTR